MNYREHTTYVDLEVLVHMAVDSERYIKGRMTDTGKGTDSYCYWQNELVNTVQRADRIFHLLFSRKSPVDD